MLLLITIFFAMPQHKYVTQYTSQHLNVFTSSRASPLTSVLFGCIDLYMLYGNHGILRHRKFVVDIPRATGKGYIYCRLPMAEVEGSMIHDIHHLTMVHIILRGRIT